ncbi:MAG TPA: TIGR00725 family protein [bacterium (Candidatus Stahlbacteria)]|nr:TIGR00725 family protein [Candidatus Stahlbacteria bacterium]
MNRIIGIIGGSSCDEGIGEIAYQVGRAVAEHGAILICGGMGGVMEQACRGARDAGGLTIGVLPGTSINSANPYVDVPIATGMGEARNVIITRTAQAVIAIDGRYGTLSEIAYAIIFRKPIIGIKTWEIKAPIKKANSAEEAVELALRLIKR